MALAVPIFSEGFGKTGHKKLDVSTTDTTVFCFYDIGGDMLRKGKKKVLGRTPYYVVTKLLDPAFFLLLFFFLIFFKEKKGTK